MIDKKHQHISFSLFMALLMSGIMSLVISMFNVGLASDIVSIWLKAWGFSFVVAFPAIIIVSPIVTLMVKFVVKADEAP